MNASVKVMNSYDYCHFEVALSQDNVETIIEIDELRKEAQRLVDRAIKQYKIAKEITGRSYQLPELRRRVQIIKENTPMSEWTPEQMATVKTLEDLEHDMAYDYEDNWIERG